MKNVALWLLLSAATLTAGAQGVFSNQTNAALQKVIEDYPHQFSNIKGARLQERERAIQFQSKVQVPGSLKCMITEFHANPNAYTWTCELYKAEDFAEASKKFQELYKQISNTIIRIGGEKPFILNGQYESPADDNNATIIKFFFLPASASVKHLKVELQLLHNQYWTIILRVSDNQEFDIAKK